jgi:hypothetical protein
MKKLIFLLLTLALILALVPAGMAKKSTPALTCTTEYDFVGNLGIFDAEGRLLAWVGPISGDIEGVVKWWLLPESPPPDAPDTAQVGHMLFRWEIWNADETELLLAGEERERTIVRHGKNSVWRANGTVTEAGLAFEDYIGSQMHDGGNFTWAAPGLPDHGEGTLRIAGSAAGSE